MKSGHWLTCCHDLVSATESASLNTARGRAGRPHPRTDSEPTDYIGCVENDRPGPQPLVGDITFEETAHGFEVHYSDRFANENQDLVYQSANWLEDQPG